MNYSQTLDYIHSLVKFTKDLSFHSIKKVLNNLSNPQDGLKIIHIAGTNGKGSTAVMLQSALTVSGKKTGLYISPFVVEFCERIQIDGNYITQDDLIYYVNQVKSASFDQGIELSEFEFITCIALKYFCDMKCDIIVLETGLGGRLDATNVISKPLFSVITKIDIDHAEILGDTVEKIACEKCGIIKDNSTVITTENQYESVKKIIEQYSNKRNCKLLYNNYSNISEKEITIQGNSFKLNEKDYITALIGEHQFDNSATAIRVLSELGLSYEDIYIGLKKAKLSARIEVVSEKPLVILDGSHNENGISALIKTLDLLNIRDFNTVLCIMKDKKVERSLSKIIAKADSVFVTELLDNHRCMSSEKLKDICQNFNTNVTEIKIENINNFISKEKPTVIFGSLYLASEVKKYL